ncbi:MAG: NifB/NifX family molybdenum-iron cluster-binding protein [Desulfuromonadales bacterium]|jgi:predicted Fe-Mo cluster-binding NifX family protein|nr:NifB/NifX family molybdenum-iron cluster-binding protein [Desulfuromonadales bacterium]
MKICFPVSQDEGLESKVYGHFGSAPMFVVVDTESSETKVMGNRDRGHAHGACRPLRALGGESLDAIVVGGIGAGALQGLSRSGLKVYKAEGLTIADNMTCLAEQGLAELTGDQVCGGHGHGHGHGHGCSH